MTRAYTEEFIGSTRYSPQLPGMNKREYILTGFVIVRVSTITTTPTNVTSITFTLFAVILNKYLGYPSTNNDSIRFIFDFMNYYLGL